jgi:hypothetical protein
LRNTKPSQNSEKRTSDQKFNKQFQGILSEIIVEEYLKMLFKDSAKIVRYDDVRTNDFKSAKNEYDINVFDLFNEDKLELYITGGCDLEMMLNKSVVKSMGQKNTEYQVVPVLQSLDIRSLTEKLRSIRNSNPEVIKKSKIKR